MNDQNQPLTAPDDETAPLVTRAEGETYGDFTYRKWVAVNEKHGETEKESNAVTAMYKSMRDELKKHEAVLQETEEVDTGVLWDEIAVLLEKNMRLREDRDGLALRLMEARALLNLCANAIESSECGEKGAADKARAFLSGQAPATHEPDRKEDAARVIVGTVDIKGDGWL